MKHRRLLIVALLALLLAGLGGWLATLAKRDLVDMDQVTLGEEVARIGQGTTVGQTFVARHRGLTGIEFYLVPDAAGPFTLTLHLRTEPQASEDLSTTRVQVPADAKPGYYRFTFPAQTASHGRYYYAFLDAAHGSAKATLAGGAAYLDGAAYQDHEPLDAQTSFHLVYGMWQVGLGLLRSMVEWAGLLAAAGFLFVIPGWALLEVWQRPSSSGSAPTLSWAEKLGLSAGIGLALAPLLFLWTNLVGLRLGAVYAWLPSGLATLFVIWSHRRWRPRDGWRSCRQWAGSAAALPDAALILVLVMLVAVRLLVVNSLETPLWGDGYQHTLISQLLVDNRGLFDSWLPYVPLDRFTYHFGFHADVAEIHWVTGLPVVSATLQTGQLLNALAVLTIYPLGVRVTGSRWGGLWAVLLAGLLSPMPMYYTNWGRYTQLAGQAILPVAMWLTWEALEQPGRQWRLLALAMLVAGGLALTHYRVLIYYLAFILALLLLLLKRGPWRELLLRTGAIGLGGGILFLPWFMHGFRGSILTTLGAQLTTTPGQADPFLWQYNAMGDLRGYLPPALWLALFFGLGLALWRHQRGPILIGLWSCLLLLMTNPAWLGLPGTGVISNFALFIAAYLPASLLSGYLLSQPLAWARGTRWAQGLALLIVVALGVYGFRLRLGDLDLGPSAYATRPDARAAEWIRNNTDPKARFVVNSSFAYGGTAVVGTDGGWWLPLLAHRQNTVPPLSYFSEVRPGSSVRQQIQELALRLEAALGRADPSRGLDDPALLDFLDREGITHLYIGERQGQVNTDNSVMFSPEVVLDSSRWHPVFHQDRVWVFELVRSGIEVR